METRLLTLVLIALIGVPQVVSGQGVLIGAGFSDLFYHDSGTRSDIVGVPFIIHAAGSKPVSLSGFARYDFLIAPQELVVQDGGTPNLAFQWESTSPKRYSPSRGIENLALQIGFGPTFAFGRDQPNTFLMPFFGFGLTQLSTNSLGGGGTQPDGGYIIDSRIPETGKFAAPPPVEDPTKCVSPLRDPCDHRRKTTTSAGVVLTSKLNWFNNDRLFFRFQPEWYQTSFGRAIQNNFRGTVAVMFKIK